jgi:type I site-specific restriction endonuclease
MDKKSFTEQDIRTKYITPDIEAAGWDKRTSSKGR